MIREQMETPIKEKTYVSASRGGRFENSSKDFSMFRDLAQFVPPASDVEKPLHQSENVLVGQTGVGSSTAEDAGASASGLLRMPTPEDALKNGLASVGEKRQAQTAERALIDRILSGQRELFIDLIRPHQRTVYATIFSLLGNKEDAQDVAQDTLVKALSRLNQFRGESAFGTWLVRIAINEARMKNRKQWRVPMLSLTYKDDEKDYVPENFEDWREIPSEAVERIEIREALVKALGSLAQHYREAFVLRDIHELSITETAEILGITRGAVKTRLRRARLTLRDILAPGLAQDGRLGWAAKEVK